jgi:hypothetical protein
VKRALQGIFFIISKFLYPSFDYSVVMLSLFEFAAKIKGDSAVVKIFFIYFEEMLRVKAERNQCRVYAIVGEYRLRTFRRNAASA